MADRYYIGIDIGGTKLAVCIADNNGKILDKLKMPSEAHKGPEQMIDKMFLMADELMGKYGIKSQDVEAFGISCGGPLDSKRGIVMSPPNLPGWDNVHITEIIQERYSRPAYLQNDANACALAEWMYGAGRGYKNVIFLTFGTGMGAGLILDGRLYSGTNDMAGEVGHIRLATFGPVGYGKEGSFEGFCSGGGIAQIAAAEVLKRRQMGMEVEFARGLKPEELTAKIVGEAADRGDGVAIEILRISASFLGLGISILIDILNPEVIIIGSIYARSIKFFRDIVEEVIKKEALQRSASVCKVVPAILGEQLGDYASIAVAMNRGR